MATNEVARPAWNLSRAVTHPTTPASGDPVVYGNIPGVALTAEDANGLCTFARVGRFALSVKGADSGGNAAIAAGDILYYNSGATPVINADDGGVRFGYADAAVGSGSTSTIDVILGF